MAAVAPSATNSTGAYSHVLATTGRVSGVSTDGLVELSTAAESAVDGAELNRLLSTDKRLLSSYGRPFDSALAIGGGGQPAPRGFYAFARAVGEVTTEEEWVRGGV